MDRCAAVRLGDLVVINFAQPVVRCDRAGVGKNKSAYGIRNGGILFHAPVVDLKIVVHQLLVVEQCGTYITHFLTLSAVQNISLRHISISGLGEHFLDAVLDIFNCDHAVPDLGFEI